MKAINKDTIKEIVNTKKRFLSILLIVLLGVGFFSGIKATSPNMQKIVDKYFDDMNMSDIQVISTLGLTKEDIEEIKKLEGVEDAEEEFSQDAIIKVNDEETVVKIHSIPDRIGKVKLKEGKMPENEKECLVEETFLLANKKNIGDNILIEGSKEKDEENDENEEIENKLENKEMKIVGTIISPEYISRERGSTKLASGKINYYMYVPKETIESKIYTKINVVVENSKKLNTFEKEYEDKVKKIKDEIEEISNVRKEIRFNSLKEEANKKVQDAEEELEKSKKEANSKIDDAKNKILNGKNEINNAKEKIKKSEIQLVNSQKKANQGFQKAENEFKKAENEISKQEKSLELGKKELISQKEKANQGIKQIDQGINELNNKILSLQEQKKQLEQIGKNTIVIEEGIKKVTAEKQKLEEQKNGILEKIKNAENNINQGENKLNSAKIQLKNKKEEFKKTKLNTNNKLHDAANKIKNGKIEISNSEKELQKHEKELEEKEKEANEKIQEANNKIQDAKDKINDIKRPQWYILDRNQNIGFASYKQDTDRIENIAKVFPVVFFVIAALISLTSMTKMVEEQRGQIGTLKALGYNKIQISSKYIIYAMLATLFGGIIGMLIGFRLLPQIIIDIYKMMYQIPETITEFNIKIALIGLGLAMFCTVGATFIACYKELSLLPAILMRPKAPKPGKRVLLEKIPFIWNKLNFIHKVTVRNLFRYKKRVLMTIIGILGCTALIVAGFGLRDSVSNMIPSQYGGIFDFDINISFKSETPRGEIEKGIEEIINISGIKEGMEFNVQSVKILSKDNNQDIQLFVPKDIENMEKYIKLENRKTRQKYKLDDEGIILTEKLSKLLNIKIGDKITIKNADEKEANVEVKGITKNYLMHYIYMSPGLYQKIFNENVKFNTMLAKEEITQGKIDEIKKSGMINEKKEEEKFKKEQIELEQKIGKQILQNKNISKIAFISQSRNIFDDVMKNMQVVVWILIISAGLLAFVVLYNLATINISERIRELATIKVLGFYDNETYQYVGRETVLLTTIGIILGLIGGYFLNMYIIKTCELDMLMFDPEVSVLTYIYSAGLTIFFTIIVSIATYFSLKKIDMIESLKSVE